MFKKILAPIYLAEGKIARPALDKAVQLADLSGAALRLLNVQNEAPVAFQDFVPETFDEELRARAERRLKEIAAQLATPQNRLTIAARSGRIYPEILAEADEWGADLIVVGSHRPSFADYLLGSNARAIAGRAKCSVLIVRDRGFASS